VLLLQQQERHSVRVETSDVVITAEQQVKVGLWKHRRARRCMFEGHPVRP
jgi:hypothetical protein